MWLLGAKKPTEEPQPLPELVQPEYGEEPGTGRVKLVEPQGDIPKGATGKLLEHVGWNPEGKGGYFVEVEFTMPDGTKRREEVNITFLELGGAPLKPNEPPPKKTYVVGQRVACDDGVGTVTETDDKDSDKATVTIELDSEYGGRTVKAPYKEVFSIAEHEFYVRSYHNAMYRVFILPGIIYGHLDMLKKAKGKMWKLTKADLSSNIKDHIKQALAEFTKLRQKIEGEKKNVERPESIG